MHHLGSTHTLKKDCCKAILRRLPLLLRSLTMSSWIQSAHNQQLRPCTLATAEIIPRFCKLITLILVHRIA